MFLLIVREILFHVSTPVHFIDHSNVTTAGFIELGLVTFRVVVRWHLDFTWHGHCDGSSIAARCAIW